MIGKFNVSPNIDRETPIVWQDTLHWQESLKQGLSCIGLEVTFNAKQVVIQKHETKHATEKSQFCAKKSGWWQNSQVETAVNATENEKLLSDPPSKQGGFILVPLKQQQEDISASQNKEEISAIPKLKPKRPLIRTTSEPFIDYADKKTTKLDSNSEVNITDISESGTQSKPELTSSQDNESSRPKELNKNTSIDSIETSSAQRDQNYLAEIHQKRINPQKFQVVIGNTLTNTINEWAKQENWLVSWNSNYDYLINANATFNGDIIQASKSLLNSMGQTEPRFFIKFYRGNKLMIITDSTRSNPN